MFGLFLKVAIVACVVAYLAFAHDPMLKSKATYDLMLFCIGVASVALVLDWIKEKAKVLDLLRPNVSGRIRW